MYHFIINPKSSSGKGIRHWWTVKDELDRRNIDYTAELTKQEGHASLLAEEICQKYDGIKNIVVLGGDGTLNEVINGIHNFDDVTLGYIPSGSSNDLARSLKIPRKPLKSLSNILKPNKFIYLDYGEIIFEDQKLKPRKFSCSSGIGYDAGVCVEVQSSPLKKKFNRFGAGKFIYLAIAIKQLFSTKFMNAAVVIDGIKKENYSKVLLISNMIHQFEGGGLKMAPHADPADGKLSICLVHGMSRLIILLLLPTIIFGRHIHFKGVETFKCSSIDIILDNKAAVHTDGEVPGFSSHINIRCIPGKIRMIL
ncbi:MAG TPA: diacylglycerol kinase family lipid kinase [Clostridiales bacterium]|jgi:YegS/Rv2252/BmrU family lipid kinase|nr:diacylglycerol kinase family lipid kinase [Clostridiales bacterium]